MSDYTQNNVLLGTPSKGYNILIMSLYEQNKDIFNMLKMSLGSTVNNKARRFISSYVWDLYSLADLTKDRDDDPSRPGYFTFYPTNPKWKKIYTSEFNDDSGSSIYSKLSNFNPLTVQNHPNFTSQKYNCDFTFSPLINIGFNDYFNLLSGGDPELPSLLSDQYEAEQIIYLTARIPMFPVMICSTIPAHYTFGPVFAEQITFSCNGGNNLPIVNVTCRFVGGKSLISPAFSASDRKKPTPEPIIYNEMNNLDGTPIEELGGDLFGYNIDYHRYRSASMIDCMVDFNEYKNLGEMKNALLSNISYPPAYKIIGFDMSISQNINLSFTYPGSTNDDYTINYFGDKVGPKFANLGSREVSGTIKYFSFDKDIILPNTSSLTLYFGGPFFFSMRYVDLNNPTVSIQPNGGYVHSYKYNARLTDNVSFPQSNNLNEVVSEFTGDSTFTVESLLDLLNKWFRF